MQWLRDLPLNTRAQLLSKRSGFRRRRATGECWIHYASHDCPNNRRNPEEPELPEGPATDKNGWTGTPGRIHRHVSDRDANQVNQRQPQTDGNRRKALRRALVSSAEDDHQEHER